MSSKLETSDYAILYLLLFLLELFPASELSQLISSLVKHLIHEKHNILTQETWGSSLVLQHLCIFFLFLYCVSFTFQQFYNAVRFKYANYLALKKKRPF